jgi:hypothetical protein
MRKQETGEDCTIQTFMICTHIMYVSKPNVIKGAGGKYGREVRHIQGYGGET